MYFLIARPLGSISATNTNEDTQRVTEIRDAVVKVLRTGGIRGTVCLAQILTDEEDEMPVCLECRVHPFDYIRAVSYINKLLSKMDSVEQGSDDPLFEVFTL